MKIKKLGALLVSAALCAGMAAPAFAFEGEAAPVEQPILPELVEEDVVTITDETSGALTPEGKGGSCHASAQHRRYQQCAQFLNLHPY